MNYIFFALFGAFLLSISDILSKNALDDNVSNINFIFWSHGVVYIFCIIALLLICLFVKPEFLLGENADSVMKISEIISMSKNKKTMLSILFSGLIAFFSLLTIIYSFKISENIGYTTAIVSSTCLFTLIFSVFFLKSKIELKGILGCLLIVIGVVLISNCSNSKRH